MNPRRRRHNRIARKRRQRGAFTWRFPNGMSFTFTGPREITIHSMPIDWMLSLTLLPDSSDGGPLAK